MSTQNVNTRLGYYAEVNLTLAYDSHHYDSYVTETCVDRTGWPDRGEWFDTLEDAKAFVDEEVRDLVERNNLEDGYRITRLVSRYDSVEYVFGSVECSELDEDGDPIEDGVIMYDVDSRPDYVIEAMRRVRRYEDLADRIAQIRGEGWKLVTMDDDWIYLTSQAQVDDGVETYGIGVADTRDEMEGRALIHVTYCG